MRGTRLPPVKGRCPLTAGQHGMSRPQPPLLLSVCLIPRPQPFLPQLLSSPNSGHWACSSDPGYQETFPAQLSLSMVLGQYLSRAGCPKYTLGSLPPFSVSILRVRGIPSASPSPPPRPHLQCFRNLGTHPLILLLTLPHHFHSFAVASSPAQEANNRQMPSLPRASPEGSARHASSKQVGPDTRSSGKVFGCKWFWSHLSLPFSRPYFRNTWRITSTAS